MGERKTIAVVGGGSAGFTAARTAASEGARVVFFMGDRADVASLCVNRGCMPSKAMFEPIDEAWHAARRGFYRVEPLQPEALLAQIVAWKDREIARFRGFRQRAISAHEGDDFTIVRADARFVDAHTLEADGRKYRFDAAIIATGSVPSRPAIPGLVELGDAVWDNEALLDNTELPESIAFVGAGAIGLEFSQRYARLGSRVTLIDRSQPLSRYPADFGARIARIYENEGVRVLLQTQVQRVRRDTEGWFLVEVDGEQGAEVIACERLAVVAGRRPAVDGLGLPAAGIEIDDGRVACEEDLRVCGSDHLFAAGDVVGRRMVVHQAHLEAGIAARNAVDGGSRCWERNSDLQVVFSDPEFGWAGSTPDALSADGIDTITARKESRLVGKLHLAGDDHGFGEFHADASDGRLLGAGLLCDGAADLIHLPAYMISHGHTAHDGAAAEYYHPARVEIVSGLLDRLCKTLGGKPPRRADAKTG